MGTSIAVSRWNCGCERSCKRLGWGTQSVVSQQDVGGWGIGLLCKLQGKLGLAWDRCLAPLEPPVDQFASSLCSTSPLQRRLPTSIAPDASSNSPLDHLQNLPPLCLRRLSPRSSGPDPGSRNGSSRWLTGMSTLRVTGSWD
jgi:hypothetical protein